MKKLLLIALLITQTADAGLITHTDYTSGNVITAAGQNTNENTIVNEFNGNISAANLATNAITTTKITDANVTTAKLSQVLQDTFTIVGQMGAYRRPRTIYVSVTTVDVEANTGTANQSCVLFPDQMRCVTENTSITSVNRRFIITEAASNSGTKNSGLRTGYVETANTWYALYAWKTSDVATDFVIVGDTLTPVQANFAALNTFYGTNSWVYLGMIRNGDNSGATSDILQFTMSGNKISFYNTAAGSSLSSNGIRLATTAGATSLTYTFAAGFGTTQIPAHLSIGDYTGIASAGAGNSQMSDQANAYQWAVGSGATRFAARVADISLGVGCQVAQTNSVAMDIYLSAYTDDVLSLGTNPQL